MSESAEWYKKRDEWRTPSKPIAHNSEQIYKPAELTIEECEAIHEVIMATKGPYAPFHKKINLADLVSLVEEVWDDDE